VLDRAGDLARLAAGAEFRSDKQTLHANQPPSRSGTRVIPFVNRQNMSPRGLALVGQRLMVKC
jgi:hypothetical protein